ncbi:TPA: sulfatase-like hydrolase/transferase [Proteus mirabilis]|nr:sulfatase-like hydrolase/transferase [Proteus mirabilis]HAT6274835.1 sulfatase-like hydrolase/transferase [Proteus mirabilis]HAT6282250.1 sulfatase-like hydrolase/transferase [Proteus mirabilis]
MYIFLYVFIICLLVIFSSRLFFIKSIFIILISFTITCWFIANEFTGMGIDDAFLYTITNSIKGTPIFDNSKYIVLTLVVFSFIFLSLYISRKFKKKNAISDFLFLLTIVVFFLHSQPVKNINELFFETNEYSDAKENYIIQNNILSNSNDNFVFIIAESLERTFKDIDGTNYLRNISEIDNFTDFSNIGYVRGSGWTIAGHVNLICGMPLIGTGNAADKIQTFMPKATCFSDILSEKGYKNIYISGTDLSFAGTKNFLSSHSFSTIIDINTLNNKYKSTELRNSWGIDDKIILDEAFNIYKEQSSRRNPFTLFVSTINTHSPGFTSPFCENKIEDRYLNSVICADKLISDFIKKIKNTPYFKNTTIILVSDHGLMQWDALIGKEIKRTNLLTVFNNKLKNEVINNEGTVLDQIPSAIDAILNNNPSLGFGRSIYNKNNSFGLLSPEYNSFSKSLWAYPSLNQNIVKNKNNQLSIGSMKFSVPICIYFDNKYDISDFGYEDGIKDRCMNDIKNKSSDNIIIFENCEKDICYTLYKDGETKKLILDDKLNLSKN